MVRVTYGHGHLYEFDEISDWSEAAPYATGSIATDGDVLTITKTAGTSYAIDNDTNLGLSSTIYTKIMGRYKTSTNATFAKAEVEFDDGKAFSLPCEYLRVFSPAADVRAARDAGQLVIGKEDVCILIDLIL